MSKLIYNKPFKVSRILSIIILITVLFFTGLLPAFSCTEEPAEKKDLSDRPRITFAETDYDFGIIKSGEDAVHYFVFSNEGKLPLVITNVRTSCGCAVPKWPKSPMGSGVKDSLRVEYNTKVKGAFNKTITVQSNAVNGEVELRIRGDVIKAK